jgi:hypothetical protein
VFQPFITAFGVVADVRVLTGRVSAAIVTPLMVDVALRLASVAFTLVVATAFFRRRKAAIALCVAWYVSGMVLVAGEVGTAMWVRELVSGKATEVDTFTLARSFGTALLWIAYFLNSKRVAATFTR